VDAERLSYLAKRASTRYLEDGVKLSEAVSGILEGEELNREQVKRVCEIANTETFRSLFEKSADKNISFPLADYREVHGEESVEARRPQTPNLEGSYTPGSDSVGDVIEELFSAGREKTSNVGKVKAYLTQGMSLPDAVKAAYPDYSDDDVQAFIKQQGPSLTKTSAYGYEVPESEVIRTWERLRGIKDYATSKLSSLQIMEKQAEMDLEEKAVQEIRQGAKFHELVSALAPFVEDKEFFSKTSADLAHKLVGRGDLDRVELVLDMGKTASSRCPNPEHPLISTYCGLEKFHKEAAALESMVASAVRAESRVQEALGIG